ncbi:hypothetical protein [Sulfitobacter geojensis]|uniref:hypothetical protein n=1 Tax=Sulfitobacter geojensis TaxID=1342299 RepID=UPI0007DA1385|nr:hypothetical protein [Sulfitobacter geojensis]OAN86231.1 hypothetical protein A8B74_08310 [Sulfitobacter geojensis]
MSKTWQDSLTGLSIVSAAVVDDGIFAFGANWDETYTGPKPPAKYHNRLVFCDLNAGTWGGKQYDGGFDFARVAGGQTAHGAPQALFTDAMGTITAFTFPDGPRGKEQPVEVRGANRLRFIGDHFYICGDGRSLLRRDTPDAWTVFNHVPFVSRETDLGAFGPFDGFSDADIFMWYAGPYDSNATDRKPGIEHWNGTDFRQVPLPTELFEDVPWAPFRAHDICCTPDGQVFVSGTKGELLLGGREGFVVLAPQVQNALPGMNLCWFKDVLYGAIDAGLFTFDFKENSWVPAPFAGDPNAPVHFPHIDANENVMLLAGAYGAAIFDGDIWTSLAGDVSALDVTRVRLMEQQVEGLEELRDIVQDLATGTPDD